MIYNISKTDKYIKVMGVYQIVMGNNKKKKIIVF